MKTIRPRCCPSTSRRERCGWRANDPGAESMTPPSTAAAGACWFCGKGRGAGDSVAYPFYAQRGDDVRVVVVPRCDACTQVHRTQMLPSGLMIGAAAVVPAALIKLAPISIPDGVRTALCAVGMVAGVVAGIVMVSGRERRGAPHPGEPRAPARPQH